MDASDLILPLSSGRVKVANSTRKRPNQAFEPSNAPVWTAFGTELGWIGLVGQYDRVSALTFGHATPLQVRQHLVRKVLLPDEAREIDWNPELRERLTAYASGDRCEFSEVSLHLEGLTPFRTSIVNALRGISYGHTVSYAELAALAGRPKAARAVGTAMAANRIPLIIPCHRVVAAGGNLGGFSAPNGLSMKQRLLQLEQVTNIRFDGALTVSGTR